jgi:hypothetical protein
MNKSLVLISLTVALAGFYSSQVLGLTPEKKNTETLNSLSSLHQLYAFAGIKNQELVDPSLFYQKLANLSKKFLKDEFESTAQYETRKKQEIDNFSKKEGVNLKEIFVTIRQINLTMDDASFWDYDAEKQTLFIYSIMFAYGNNPLFKVYDQTNQFLYHLDLKNKQAISNSDYWLDRKYRFSPDGKAIAIPNISPDLAKKLLTEKRLLLKIYFQINDPFVNHNGIVGELRNIHLVDKNNGKWHVIWSLNPSN